MRITCACLLLAALAIAALVPDPLLGDSLPPTEENTPEAIATRALVALRANRIDDYVKEVHPDGLASIKAIVLEAIDAAEKKGRVAEALRIFKGVSEPGQLRKMNDTEFYTAFYPGVLSRRPSLSDPFMGKARKFEVVGHVPDGNDVVHVVYRATASLLWGDDKISKMCVISLKADGDSWRVLPSADAVEMAKLMKGEFELNVIECSGRAEPGVGADSR